jgi:hypothetical protein
MPKSESDEIKLPGSAKDRRKGRRLLERMGVEVSHVPPRSANTPVRRFSQRLLDFVEQPLFTLPIGIIGGIVGVLVYAPVSIVCGVCIALAFHRAGVVAGEKWRKQAAAYIVLAVLLAVGLYGLHTIIIKNLPHLATATEIVDEWQKRFGKPQEQPNERAGQPPTAPSNQPQFGELTEKVEVIDFTVAGLTAGEEVENLKKGPRQPFLWAGFAPITAYIDKRNRLHYKIKFWDGTRKSPIEINDNDFVVRDPFLDRNFNRNALEVVKDGKPIFQMIRENPSHIIINGIFVLPDGKILLGKDFHSIYNPLVIPESFKLEPIFKYPSWKYPGRFIDEANDKNIPARRR